MATAEPATRPLDRHHRRRPFATWMKRLANLKSSSSDSPSTSKKGHGLSPSHKKALKNNPYPESGRLPPTCNANGHLSFSSPISHAHGSFTSLDGSEGVYSRRAQGTSTKSTAPTVATNPETIGSEAGQSKTGTSNTVGGGVSSLGGQNSTFSSPNHSVRSLTTTLTTVQSTAPSAMLGQQNAVGPMQQTNQAQNPVQFTHQYPISPPASALPPHLSPQQNAGGVYHGTTANNVLTDNASILTLASSSKRRRRHSLDTDASVRAIAPSSLWGGSRESLPLSVLSSNVEAANSTPSGAIYSTQSRPNGIAGAERVSVYSSSGVTAPALSSDRNSYYANKQGVDGASIRSGLLSHGRTDSINGSIGPGPSSPLASPRDTTASSRMNRRSGDWREDRGEVSEEEGSEQVEKKDVVKEPATPI